MNIKKARNIIAKAFKDDPGFRMSYQANIAMLIYDDQRAGLGKPDGLPHPFSPASDLTTGEGCNSMADNIIKLIFES